MSVGDIALMDKGGIQYVPSSRPGGDRTGTCGVHRCCRQLLLYDAFGVDRGVAGEVSSLYRFATKRLNTDLRLYHFKARSYEALNGRFISMDPLHHISAFPPYSFALSTPLVLADPTGMRPVPPGTECYIDPIAGGIVCRPDTPPPGYGPPPIPTPARYSVMLRNMRELQLALIAMCPPVHVWNGPPACPKATGCDPDVCESEAYRIAKDVSSAVFDLWLSGEHDCGAWEQAVQNALEFLRDLPADAARQTCFSFKHVGGGRRRKPVQLVGPRANRRTQLDGCFPTGGTITTNVMNQTDSGPLALAGRARDCPCRATRLGSDHEHTNKKVWASLMEDITYTGQGHAMGIPRIRRWPLRTLSGLMFTVLVALVFSFTVVRRPPTDASERDLRETELREFAYAMSLEDLKLPLLRVSMKMYGGSMAGS